MNESSPLRSTSSTNIEGSNGGHDDSHHEECVICLEQLFRDDDSWGHCIPCNHAFHKQCWWKWENAYQERLERMQRQGNFGDVEERNGPKCCLCNTVVQTFVSGTGETARNPQPHVLTDDGEERMSFFERLFRRRQSESRGVNDMHQDNDHSTSPSQARQFLERLAERGESIMGMDASVLLDQIRFGADWGSNPFSPRRRVNQSRNNNGDGRGINLGQLFEQWTTNGSESSNTRNRSRNWQEGTTPFNEIRPGSLVVVQYLVNSMHLNGQRGRVQEYQQQTGRYLVKLLSNSSTVSVKKENILQIVTIKIHGVNSRPHLNEKEGIICSYDRERNRYVVRLSNLASETNEISLQPANIRIPTGTQVRLEKLTQQPQWNGRYGTIVNFDNDRYEVKLSNLYSVRVKVDNVML